MSLHLETASCSLGCSTRALFVCREDGSGFRVFGCGGPYGNCRPFPVADLTARERKEIEKVVAFRSSRREISVEDAERFLAEVFR